ncbi:30S ribosomal protein S20 [Acetobacteraceae bacterium]|nr:30S ribosomal protein S20 [Acetobacteraceae bacterium]
MANNPSALKRIRQNEKRRLRNASRLSRTRTFIKKVELAVAEGKKEEALAAFRLAQPEMQRAATKGIIPHGAINRKLSRLSARIKAIA